MRKVIRATLSEEGMFEWSQWDNAEEQHSRLKEQQVQSL